MRNLRSAEYHGEATLIQRLIARNGEVNESTFIQPFILSCSEYDLTPDHVKKEKADGAAKAIKEWAKAGVVPIGEIAEQYGIKETDGTSTLYVNDPKESDEYARLPTMTVIDEPYFTFKQLTIEHTAWIQHNFPEQLIDPLRAEDGFDGLVEEVGELARARLKKRQGIRGTAEEHDANIRDSIGDIVIFLNSWCIAHGIDLGECVETAWKEVRERDWKKYPKNGRPPVTPELHVGEKVDTSLGEGKLIYADREMLDDGSFGKGQAMVRIDI